MRKIILIALTFLFLILSVKACNEKEDCGTELCIGCVDGRCTVIC